MTYAVLAPEHPLSTSYPAEQPRRRERAAGAGATSRDIERMLHTRAPLAKRGVFTGSSALNPFTGQSVPIYVADYVLMGYGTGAIMAVPAEDERDWEFAQATGCRWCAPSSRPTDWDGRRLHRRRRQDQHGFLDGLDSRRPKRGPPTGSRSGGSASARSIPAPRLVDLAPALLGLPDPRHHCPTTGSSPSPRTSCRCSRPTTSSSCRPATRRSPGTQGSATSTCPRLRRPGERETDTMDTFVDSSWYFLRFCDPWTSRVPFDELARAFMPVDQYIGGIEHAILHLLYARFYTKALADVGLAPGGRGAVPPLFTQGMIRMDGSKMSKSKGNLDRPGEYFETEGADASAPPPPVRRAARPTTSTGPTRSTRWSRVRPLPRPRLPARRRRGRGAALAREDEHAADIELRRATHRLIAKVSSDLERWSFHTAVAACREFANALRQYQRLDEGGVRAVWDDAVDTLLLLWRRWRRT